MAHAPQMTLYRFKVSLVGDRAVPINQLHRIIDISANAPFVALHEAIFDAFDRHDPHACKFILTRQEVCHAYDLYDFNEEVGDPEFSEDIWADAEQTAHDLFSYTIGEAGLQEKDCIYYWFDFGDDWLHRLRVEKIYQIDDDEPDNDGYIINIVKKVGPSPAQYEDDSVWANEDLQ